MSEIVHLPVIQPRPHISFSEWQLFRNVCEWRWHIDYALEKRSKTESIELSFGTAIHSTLELLKNKKKEDRLSLDKAKSFFTRSLIKEHISLKREHKRRLSENLPTNRPYNIREYHAAGFNILERIDSCQEIREGTVVWNEHELFLDIERSDGHPIKFKGYIDIAIRVKPKRGKDLLFICDFKTCSWGWPFDKKNDLNVQAQLVLYKHFVCKKFGLDPKHVRTAFILLKKKPKKPEETIEFYQFSTGPKTMERVLEMFQTDITKMISGPYEKNRSSCKSKYGDVCPYYKTEHCTGPEHVVMSAKEPNAATQENSLDIRSPVSP